MIPDSVTTIGNFVFDNCTSLTSIVITDSVTKIGSYVFQNCISLISIAIPNSVTRIDREVFYNCTSLTSITISDLTAISLSAFDGYSKVTTITAPSFSTTTFGNNPDDLKNLLVNAGFDYITLDTILYCGNNWNRGCDTYYNMKAWGR